MISNAVVHDEAWKNVTTLFRLCLQTIEHNEEFYPETRILRLRQAIGFAAAAAQIIEVVPSLLQNIEIIEKRHACAIRIDSVRRNLEKIPG